MLSNFHDLIIGLGATAFFAFLPSAVRLSRIIAIPGVIVSLFITLHAAAPDISSLLHRIHGTGNEDIPLWLPYLLGSLLTLIIIGFARQIISAIKAYCTYLELQIKFLDSNPDKYWFSCNIFGYDYFRNKENGATKNCILYITFKHHIPIDKLNVKFEGNKKINYTTRKINDLIAVVEFDGEVPIGYLIVTVSK